MFCGKCGAKIETNTKFCPQCGAPLKADSSRPGRAPAASQKAVRWRSPTQGIAVAVYVVSVLLMWGILLLWEKDSISISGLTTQEVISLAEMFLSDPSDQNVIALGCLSMPYFAIVLPVGTAILHFIIKKILDFLIYLISKRSSVPRTVIDYDLVSEIILTFSLPFLSGPFLIGSIVFYVLGLAGANDEVAKYNGLLKVGPTAMGWLYIMACAALAGVVIVQAVLYFKLRKEKKEHMVKNS